MSTTAPPRPRNLVLRTTLVWSACVTVGLAVVGGLAGLLIVGVPGLLSVFAGVLASALFLAVTALSILAAQRFFGRPDQIAAYFGVVIGSWLVKLVVFVALLLALRTQPWVQPYLFLAAVVVSVLASLVVDVVAFARVRVPYVGDIELPEPPDDGDSAR